MSPNKRLPDESFKDYKSRMRAQTHYENFKKTLRGRIAGYFYQSKDDNKKQKPYVKAA